MLFGTAAHAALQFMFSRDPLFPTLDEVVNYFQTQWNKECKENTRVVSEAEFAAYNQTGIEIIKKFYTANQPWNFSVLGLETFCHIPLKDPQTGSNHMITGKIDRIDKTEDGIEIIDYKTSRRLPSQQSLDADLQLSIYSMGVLSRWPNLKSENIKLSLYFLRHDEKLSTIRSHETLENTKQEILGVIRSIEQMIKTNDFPVYTTGFCNLCPLCPAWRHFYDRSPSEQEIQAIVEEYITLDAENKKDEKRLKELKEKINMYLDSNDLEGLFGKEAYVQRSEIIRKGWNLQRVQEILEPFDLWQKIQGPDENKLKELFPELSLEIKGKLETARTIKTSTMLRIKTQLPSSAEEIQRGEQPAANS